MADIAGLVDLASRSPEALEELAFIGDLMDHRFRGRPLLGEPSLQLRLPDNYGVFDLETSGFDPKEDLIVEVGWAIVNGRQVSNHAGMILNWTAFDPANREFQDWLRWKLRKTAESFALKGRTYHITIERMQREGVPPIDGLRDFATILWTFMNAGMHLVGHGAWQFDRKRIDIATESFLEYTLPWHLSPMFDTGLIEKASQLGKNPVTSETLDEWYTRVNGTWSRCKWNLDGHCSAKYDLAERYHLDLSLAHTAGFDCLLTYALAETFRYIGEAFRGATRD